MSKQPIVLIVEDNVSIAETIGLYLKKWKITYDIAVDGLIAKSMFSKCNYDLLLLDIMLPEVDGLSLCRDIRQRSKVPIILITSKTTENDIIAGLEAGADDYICKPFSPRELVARVRSTLRRIDYQEQAQQKLNYGDLQLDLEVNMVFKKEKKIILTKSEFVLLKTLMSYPERVFTRNQLIDAVFGQNSYSSDRTIDTHMYNLRKKIESNSNRPEYIHTEYGVGYRLLRNPSDD